jgi:hypothetical protein
MEASHKQSYHSDAQAGEGGGEMEYVAIIKTHSVGSTHVSTPPERNWRCGNTIIIIIKMQPIIRPRPCVIFRNNMIFTMSL